MTGKAVRPVPTASEKEAMNSKIQGEGEPAASLALPISIRRVVLLMIESELRSPGGILAEISRADLDAARAWLVQAEEREP